MSTEELQQELTEMEFDLFARGNRHFRKTIAGMLKTYVAPG
jgi:hypothetical protein